MSVVLLGALIAAMMSTADSALMAIAAMLSNDLLGCYYPRPLSVSAQLWAAKASTVVSCVLLVLISQAELYLVSLGALQQQEGATGCMHARTHARMHAVSLGALPQRACTPSLDVVVVVVVVVT